MQPRRGTTLAAVFDCAVSAGIMESSSGSDTATPMPFSIVRRDKCFLLTNIIVDVSLFIKPCSLNRRAGAIRLGFDLHTERRALDDAGHQIRKAVMIGRRAG